MRPRTSCNRPRWCSRKLPKRCWGTRSKVDGDKPIPRSYWKSRCHARLRQKQKSIETGGFGVSWACKCRMTSTNIASCQIRNRAAICRTSQYPCWQRYGFSLLYLTNDAIYLDFLRIATKILRNDENWLWFLRIANQFLGEWKTDARNYGDICSNLILFQQLTPTSHNG